MARRTFVLGAAGVLASPEACPQTGARVPRPTRHFDSDRFVDDIRRASLDGDAQAAVEELLRRTVEQPRRITDELGDPTEAGIHTIYRGDDVTILNVVWAPLMVLLPHNHNMWASIGIYTGRENNILWERRGKSITAVRAASLAEKEVLGLPADAIHSVTNPVGRLTGAIHVYGGDFFAPGRSEWDADMLRERPWNLDAARDEFRKASARFAAVP